MAKPDPVLDAMRGRVESGLIEHASQPGLDKIEQQLRRYERDVLMIVTRAMASGDIVEIGACIAGLLVGVAGASCGMSAEGDAAILERLAKLLESKRNSVALSLLKNKVGMKP